MYKLIRDRINALIYLILRRSDGHGKKSAEPIKNHTTAAKHNRFQFKIPITSISTHPKNLNQLLKKYVPNIINIIKYKKLLPKYQETLFIIRN